MREFEKILLSVLCGAALGMSDCAGRQATMYGPAPEYGPPNELEGPLDEPEDAGTAEDEQETAPPPESELDDVYGPPSGLEL